MIVTIVFCLGCSAVFHLLNVKSPEWNSVLARLDYGGISFTIFGC
jgi:predicted membrane channel-forming protein YqfA (hemolysin III family)